MPITIVGLGPGAIDDLSLKAWRTLDNAETVYLRTERHPCVPELPDKPRYHSFDHLYENETRFADVYATITQTLIAKAQSGETVVYCVPGDPLVGESTTTRILAMAEENDIEVTIINGISFIEPMLMQIGIDALDGLQIYDGLDIASMHHPPLNPAYPALIGQVYSREVASNIKLVLMNQYPDDFQVTLIHGAGNETGITQTIPLSEIDHQDAINHLTSLYVPALGEYTSFEAFQEIIAHLRAPEGCPWDRKQTHESLRPFLIEEAYEVLEAIDNEDWDNLAGELGDLLLQIVLHTQIAIEYGEFYMTDVLDYVNRKMIRRHPHVWGEIAVDGAEQVTVNWEDIKRQERAEKGEQRESILDGVPKGAPSLLVANKYQAKAAKVGFDWADVSGVQDKIREEMDEIFAETEPAKQAEEIADLMFVLVNWLRWLDVDDPESLMRGVNAKFYRRFTYVEEHADRDLSEMTLQEMDTLWNTAKEKGL
ncbi:MAG: nucleoside triphosphate pyrophosphohydrolase [Chloroflexota bacterium]